MARQHGRIAIYAPWNNTPMGAESNRFLFDGFAHYYPHYNDPYHVEKDRLGLNVMWGPPNAPENVSWPTGGSFVFLRPRFMLRHAQVKSGGVWQDNIQSDNSTVLINWLHTHCIGDRSEMVVFVESHGYKQGGTEYFRRRYYKGKISRAQGNSNVEQIFGDLMSTDGAALPRYIQFEFVNYDCGSFTDFDNFGSMTSDGAWPT